ncbi:GrpB family protein [Desulfosporosinus sp. FKA]|uniref:GrpB family protein n=1 Tax=Desulfosporosinus sp. FKA TaxID=1969834 RepID=UPI000B4A2631|nr:GrpB family protein [Desulfosporosinus sp. FKA]
MNLVEYVTHWPHLFEREAKRIISALGGKALLVEHIGSTSVPGLCANPKPSEVRTEQIIYIRKGS